MGIFGVTQRSDLGMNPPSEGSDEERRIAAPDELFGCFPSGQGRKFIHGTRVNGTGRTDIHAGGLFPFVETLGTEVTFLHLPVLPILGNAERAGRQTHLTPNTKTGVHEDQAVFSSLRDGFGVTYLLARRGGTVHAGEREVSQANIGIGSGLQSHDPSPKDIIFVDGMMGLTGHDTGIT